MKNLIIAGASRAGKSMVAKAVAKRLNISYIPFDSIISTVGNLYPEHGVNHYDDTLCASKEIAAFLKEFLSHLEYEGINFIIDIYQIKPLDLADAIDLDNYKVIYIGYPTIPLEDKIYAVRHAARPQDWTEDISDEELAPIIKGFIEDSIVLTDQCQKAHIPFVDTTDNFEDSIRYAIDYLCEP